MSQLQCQFERRGFSSWPRNLSHHCNPRHRTSFARGISITLSSPLSTRLAVRSAATNAQEYSRTTLAKCDLREALSRLDRGLIAADSKIKDKIEKSIQALEASQKDAVTTSHESLSATWRMLWTTEKETLFILKWAPLFGTKAGGVYQPIDVRAGSLSNVITFPPAGSFLVNSTVQVLSDKSLGFKFTKATLQLPDRAVELPPYGQGWFDNVYLDEELRISKDSRGDTLVTERVQSKDASV